MPAYNYVFADLRTDQTITEIDLGGVTFGRRIIVPGAFKGGCPLNNLDQTEQARKIVPGRTVCHVYRDADVWGPYIIWYAEPAMDENGDTTLQLSGASLESYLYARKIRANLTYAGDDQLDIARDLLDHMQTRVEGNIGLQLAAGASGILRDRTYLASENASYGQRLQELANVINGFDYLIRVTVDPVTGDRVREWVHGYPLLGNLAANHVVSQPGQVLSWKYPQDATQAATAWQTRGDTIQNDLGTPSEPLMSTVYEDAAKLGAGWPLLDQTEDMSSVRLVSTLNARAQQLRDTRSGLVGIPRITVGFGEDFVFHPNQLGDAVKLALVNDWFPLDANGYPTFDHSWRVVGMDVTPEEGDQQEKAELIFEEAA